MGSLITAGTVLVEISDTVDAAADEFYKELFRPTEGSYVYYEGAGYVKIPRTECCNEL